MQRDLYLVAYDICDPKRLSRTRNFLKGFSTGGQKSVFECFLTQGELREVVSGVSHIIDENADRVHIFSLDGRSRSHTLGVALPPKSPEFFYFG
jgi:CRISPR-associated protein Cas2